MLDQTKVTKSACSWFGPPSSGSLTPATLRGPAAIGHPWPGAALAASMPLGPRSKACVRPAPKSRFAASELSRKKSKAKAKRAVRFTHFLVWKINRRYAAESVAARLAGGDAREIATAGKLDWTATGGSACMRSPPARRKTCRSRLAGECGVSDNASVPEPPRSPASRLLQQIGGVAKNWVRQQCEES